MVGGEGVAGAGCVLEVYLLLSVPRDGQCSVLRPVPSAMACNASGSGEGGSCLCPVYKQVCLSVPANLPVPLAQARFGMLKQDDAAHALCMGLLLGMALTGRGLQRPCMVWVLLWVGRMPVPSAQDTPGDCIAACAVCTGRHAAVVARSQSSFWECLQGQVSMCQRTGCAPSGCLCSVNCSSTGGA